MCIPAIVITRSAGTRSRAPAIVIARPAPLSRHQRSGWSGSLECGRGHRPRWACGTFRKMHLLERGDPLLRAWQPGFRVLKTSSELALRRVEAPAQGAATRLDARRFTITGVHGGVNSQPIDAPSHAARRRADGTGSDQARRLRRRPFRAAGRRPRRAAPAPPRACRGPARSCPRRSGCRRGRDDARCRRRSRCRPRPTA
jgi:hypothetical protein